MQNLQYFSPKTLVAIYEDLVESIEIASKPYELTRINSDIIQVAKQYHDLTGQDISEALSVDEELLHLKKEISHAHEVLTTWGAGKEHWSLAGRIDGFPIVLATDMAKNIIGSMEKGLKDWKKSISEKGKENV